MPNSRRNIEPEIMASIMDQFHVHRMMHIVDHSLVRKCMGIIAPRPTVGSLAAVDAFETYDLQQFLRLSGDITKAGATGSEWFPGEFLHPVNRDVTLPESVHQLLVQYYTAAYDAIEGEPARTASAKAVVTQYGRVRIGAEVFGSMMSSRHQSSACILAKFAGVREEQIDTYPGQVQYYIRHVLEKRNGERIPHYLAYVRWYRPASTSANRFHYGAESAIELWTEDFYEASRDSLIPVHQIAGRFVAIKVTLGSRRQSTYLAAVPLNRRFHL